MSTTCKEGSASPTLSCPRPDASPRCSDDRHGSGDGFVLHRDGTALELCGDLVGGRLIVAVGHVSVPDGRHLLVDLSGTRSQASQSQDAGREVALCFDHEMGGLLDGLLDVVSVGLQRRFRLPIAGLRPFSCWQ